MRNIWISGIGTVRCRDVETAVRRRCGPIVESRPDGVMAGRVATVWTVATGRTVRGLTPIRTVRTLAALALALLAVACGESARPVVVAAPVVVTPAPVPVVVAEEPEPAAWRCVREGRCAVPRDIDGGVLR
jgi:hypothetical protein